MASSQQKLTPKKYAYGVGGLGLFATGGCLMWTVVLIPLAVPLALVGLGMAIASLFVKTETLVCPACQASSQVEAAVQTVKCPHCDLPIRRDGRDWVRVV
jgi:hypothetical protein